MRTATRWMVVLILLAHGLIHLLGTAKGLGWAAVEALTEPIGTAAGVLWLTAAVLVVGGPAQSNFAAGTPQAAFQNFVDAAQRSDWVTANSLLSAPLKDRGMDAQSAAGFINVGGMTVSIDSSSGSGDRVTLYVSYQMGSGSVIPPYSAYSMSSSVDMVRESDGWKLDSQVGPGK